MFGGHIRGRTDNGVRLRQPDIARHPEAAGEAEVHDFRLPIRGDHHVGRLEIAVDEASFVSVCQALRELADDPRHLSRQLRLLVLPDVIGERPTVDVLHRDVVRPGDLSHFVQLADVGMVHGTGRLSLATEAFQQRRVIARLKQRNLDRHLIADLWLVQLGIEREINRSHRSLAQMLPDLEPPERHGQCGKRPAVFRIEFESARSDRLATAHGLLVRLVSVRLRGIRRRLVSHREQTFRTADVDGLIRTGVIRQIRGRVVQSSFFAVNPLAKVDHADPAKNEL